MRKDQIDYWLNPTSENLPHTYFECKGRSRMLVHTVKNKIALESDRTIIELGCNVGRNLRYLETAGYIHLTGIDVNPKALDMVTSNSCLMLGPIEKVLPTILSPYGLVFTMAVLQHIPPENDKIFEHVARPVSYTHLTLPTILLV